MTRDVCICSLADTVRECAQAMGRNDIGVLPVAENNLLVGMVTDRDIVVRAIAAGNGADTPVREVMSRQVLYCFADQDLAHVAKSMGVARVRRVPVLDRDQSLVGMLSLADVARCDAEVAAAALAEVSQPGGHHSQTAGPKNGRR